MEGAIFFCGRFLNNPFFGLEKIRHELLKEELEGRSPSLKLDSPTYSE